MRRALRLFHLRSAGRRVAGLVACLAAAWTLPSAAAPEVDLHDMKWFVHVDLIDAGAGRDLPFWQGVIDDAIARGSDLLEGRNGPADQACCTRLTRSVDVATFGSPNDGLDVLDTSSKQNIIQGLETPGSRAFLIDSLTWCDGSAPTAIGCAARPNCSGNPNDDPNLWMAVTVDAWDDGTLPAVIAHERGHNACLQHVADAKCQLMQPAVYTPGLGGCLAPSECTSFRNARTEISSGLECGCHDDFDAPLDDGSLCDSQGGVCSGGLCGLVTEDAGAALVVAADAGDAALAPEEALRMSTLSGDWTDLGPFSGTLDDVRGLAYAHDSNTLYGIVPTVFDDSVVTIDPDSGDILSWVGTVANGASEFVGLAYDPGPTSSPTDDRLLTLEVDTSNQMDQGTFYAIDPAAPGSPTLLGRLAISPASLFTGLAYDSAQDRLYMATPFGPNGLYRTDLSACSFYCPTTQLTTPGLFFRENASLAYSRDSGMLYLVGNSFGAPNTRTFYNVIDPASGLSVETLSVDRFTPAGLAAVPEPTFVTGVTAGALSLLLTASRRRPRAR